MRRTPRSEKKLRPATRPNHLTWLGLGLLAVLAAAPAEAKTRRDPLAGQPAIRHRYEYRQHRFTIGPSFAFSINRALRHAIMFGARLEYHVNDYLALGADVGYGVGIDTGLANELEGNYKSRNLAPDWDRAKNRFADLKLTGDVRATFTPFSGKIAIFGKLFMAYDLYFFAGFGFGMTENNTTEVNPPDCVTRYGTGATCDYDAANEGFRPGFAWGLGMRFFFAKWMSMQLELKDLLFEDNESGEDTTRGLTGTELGANGGAGAILVDGDDRDITNHFFVGLSFTFYFPTNPAITF